MWHECEQKVYTLIPCFNRSPFNGFWKQRKKSDATNSVYFSIKVPLVADGGFITGLGPSL